MTLQDFQNDEMAKEAKLTQAEVAAVRMYTGTTTNTTTNAASSSTTIIIIIIIVVIIVITRASLHPMEHCFACLRPGSIAAAEVADIDIHPI